jgi:hypothetical protein
MSLQRRKKPSDVLIWMLWRRMSKKRFVVPSRSSWSFDFYAVILLFFVLQKKSEASEAGSQVAEEDYDVDEEYDNDYADNYFDNGEGDDLDDLGGGGGGGDPSGGGELGSFVGS